MSQTKTSARERREQSKKAQEKSGKNRARARDRRSSDSKKGLWITWLIIALFVVVVGVGVFLAVRPVTSGGVEIATTDTTIEGVKSYGEIPASHVSGPVTYTQTPPVGGDHNVAWQNCGIYDEPVPNENSVHSLEHGAVWITYRSDLPADQVEKLRSVVRGRTFVLLSPYNGLPSPIVASAWGKQLLLENPDDERLVEFLAQYVQGPQTLEPGAACTGGVGTPVE